MDVRGFDSSIILILRGGIPRPIGDFPESLSQAISVGIMFVGRLGVLPYKTVAAPPGIYGQFSRVQPGEMGPAPGRFELSKGIMK